MSRSYDIDFEAENAKAAIRAIIARIQGDWDHPDLKAVGPLSPMTIDDVLMIAQKAGVSDEESDE